MARLVQDVSALKRNALAAPFYLCFDEQEKSVTGSPRVVHYREDEAFYVSALPDRVTVIFCVSFKEDVDVIIGKVFLQVRDSCRSRRNFLN